MTGDSGFPTALLAALGAWWLAGSREQTVAPIVHEVEPAAPFGPEDCPPCPVCEAGGRQLQWIQPLRVALRTLDGLEDADLAIGFVVVSLAVFVVAQSRARRRTVLGRVHGYRLDA